MSLRQRGGVGPGALSSVLYTCSTQVHPGEVVELSRNGIRSCSTNDVGRRRMAFCIFEYVYFARPDSNLQGQYVHTVRMECGIRLAKDKPVEADIVSMVPDSAKDASLGFAQQSGIPYKEVLYRNGYIGRSFIQPCNLLRQSNIRKKFSVFTSIVRDKRVVLVDDSVVRGNTMGIIVRMLKEHNAKEVHIRVASSPIKYPCNMGVNIPDRNELIAADSDLEQIRRRFGADSVEYLSPDALEQSVRQNIAFRPIGHCMACITGQQPIDF